MANESDEEWGRISNELAESVEDLRSQLEDDAEEECAASSVGYG
jgi:hypothetical protein